MKNRATIFGLAAITASLFIFSPAVADDADVPRYITAQWTLALDSDGKITALGSGGEEYDSALRGRLEEIVRTWHFTPGKLNGQSAATKTTLTVHARLDSTGASDYRVHIVDAHTGGGFKRAVNPAYPISALRMGHRGLVAVSVDYDVEGRVTSASRAEGTERGIDYALVRASLDAARQWTFEPEAVGGRAVTGSIVLPFCFSIEGKEERCFLEGAREPVESARPIAWTSVASVETTAATSTK